MSTEKPGSGRLVLALVGLLTLAALAARLAGISSRLPHQTEPDSVIVTQAAWLDRPAGVEVETPEAYPAEFYPRLLSTVLWLLPGRSYARALPAGAPLAAHLRAAAEPFVRGRILVALLSVLAIPCTFLLARRFLDPAPALLAAAFVATSLIGEFYGAQARPHAASATLSLLAVLAALRLRRSGSLAASALAGLAAALAIGSLWNGVFVLPAILAAFFLASRRRPVGLALVISLVAVSVFVFYDFLFRTSALHAGEVKMGGQKLRWDSFDGSGFARIAKGFWSFDPVLLAAAGLGGVLLAARFLRRERPPGETLRDLAVAVAFPLSFALFWGATSRVPPRFALPLLPYLAVLAAYGVASALPRRSPAALRIAAALAALGVPAYACVHLARVRATPDTLTLAARWIADNVDRERETVCLPYLGDLPLFRERSALEAVPLAVQSPWQRYQRRLSADAELPAWRIPTLYDKASVADGRLDAAEVRSLLGKIRPAYVLAFQGADSGEGWSSAREVLRQEDGEPVADFPPCAAEDLPLADIGFEQADRALAKVLSMSRPGPWVEIYRTRREGAGEGAPR